MIGATATNSNRRILTSGNSGPPSTPMSRRTPQATDSFKSNLLQKSEPAGESPKTQRATQPKKDGAAPSEEGVSSFNPSRKDFKEKQTPEEASLTVTDSISSMSENNFRGGGDTGGNFTMRRRSTLNEQNFFKQLFGFKKPSKELAAKSKKEKGEFDEQMKLIKDGHKDIELKQFIKVAILAQGFFIVASFVVQLASTELFYYRLRKLQTEQAIPIQEIQANGSWEEQGSLFLTINCLRLANSCMVFIMVVLTFLINMWQSLSYRLQGKYPLGSTVLNCEELPFIVVEFIFILPHMPPFIEKIPWARQYYFQLEPAILVLMSMKIVYFGRILEYWSPLNNQGSKLIMQMSRVQETGRFFLVKAWITLNPIKTLLLSLFGYIIVSAYIVTVIERASFFIDQTNFNRPGLCYGSDEQDYMARVPGSESVTFLDSIWMLTITFLTVGYGDKFPMTTTGRAIAVLTAIFGQVYAATITGILQNNLMFSILDTRMFNMLNNKKKQDQRKVIAANAIKTLFKLNLAIKKESRRLISQGYFDSMEEARKSLMPMKNKRISNINFWLYKYIGEFKQLTREIYNTLNAIDIASEESKIYSTQTALAHTNLALLTLLEKFKMSQIDTPSMVTGSASVPRRSILPPLESPSRQNITSSCSYSSSNSASKRLSSSQNSRAASKRLSIGSENLDSYIARRRRESIAISEGSSLSAIRRQNFQKLKSQVNTFQLAEERKRSSIAANQAKMKAPSPSQSNRNSVVQWPTSSNLDFQSDISPPFVGNVSNKTTLAPSPNSPAQSRSQASSASPVKQRKQPVPTMGMSFFGSRHFDQVQCEIIEEQDDEGGSPAHSRRKKSARNFSSVVIDPTKKNAAEKKVDIILDDSSASPRSSARGRQSQQVNLASSPRFSQFASELGVPGNRKKKKGHKRAQLQPSEPNKLPVGIQITKLGTRKEDSSSSSDISIHSLAPKQVTKEIIRKGTSRLIGAKNKNRGQPELSSSSSSSSCSESEAEQGSSGMSLKRKDSKPQSHQSDHPKPEESIDSFSDSSDLDQVLEEGNQIYSKLRAEIDQKASEMEKKLDESTEKLARLKEILGPQIKFH